MRIFRIAAFCVSGTIWAQVAPLPPSTGDSAIEGTTVDAVTGEPVRKAIVTLSGSAVRTAISGVDGRFVFERLPEGTYQVAGTRAERLGGTLSDRLKLAKAERVTGVVVKVTAPAAVSGRVLDEDGDPITGAHVSLLRPNYARRTEEFGQVYRATTDDRGEYRIHSVRPGRYTLRAEATVLNPQFAQSLYVPMVPPNTRAAEVIRLSPGTDFRADIRMEKQRPTTITGRFVGMPENPHDLQLDVTSRDSQARSLNVRSQLTWNDDGTFTIAGIPAGRYWVVGMIPPRRRDEPTLSGIASVDTTGGSVRGVTLSLAAGVEVTGRLRIEGDVVTPLQAHDAMLIAAGGTARGPGPRADVDEQGRFRFAHVLPGIWDIHVDPYPTEGYVKSMKLGDQDVLRTEMEIGTTVPGELEIVVTTKGAVIEGMVSEAKKGTPVQVWAFPEGTDRDLPRFQLMAKWVREGRYRVQGVRPGKYRVYAIAAEAVAIGLRDPEVLEALKSKSALVTVEEGARVAQDVTLITAEELATALHANL